MRLRVGCCIFWCHISVVGVLAQRPEPTTGRKPSAIEPPPGSLQPSPTRVDPTSTATDSPKELAPEDAAIEPDVAVSRALDIFNRIDSGEEDEIPPSFISDLNRYITILQIKSPQNPWLSYIWGRTSAILGRGGEAIDRLKRFVDTREGRNEWPAFRVLGDLLVQEFPRLAKSNYEKAQALKPREPAVLYGLSHCAYQTGSTAEAIQLAQDAVDADRRRGVRYPAHLAKVLLQDNKREEAERAAILAIDIARQKVKAQPTAVKPLLVAEQQLLLLIEVLRAKVTAPAGVAGLVEDSQHLAAAVRERAALADKLAWHDALRVLEFAANRSNPNTPTTLLEQYATALAEVGRTEEAIATFEKILSAQPENPVATAWLQRLKP